MGLLNGLLDGIKNAGSGSGVIGNALGLDTDTSGLLGMAFMGATGNHNMMKRMLMMQMMNEGTPASAAPAAGVPMTGANPDYKMPVPASTQATVKGLMKGVTPTGFAPGLQGALPQVMEEMRSKGWDPIIASGIRTPAEQAEKVRLGYSGTMHSKHLEGKAADIVDRRYGWDGPAADKNFQYWKDLQEAATRAGLKSGGDWKIRDVAHVQSAMLQQQQQQQQLQQANGLLNQNSQNYYA